MQSNIPPVDLYRIDVLTWGILFNFWDGKILSNFRSGHVITIVQMDWATDRGYHKYRVYIFIQGIPVYFYQP